MFLCTPCHEASGCVLATGIGSLIEMKSNGRCECCGHPNIVCTDCHGYDFRTPSGMEHRASHLRPPDEEEPELPDGPPEPSLGGVARVTGVDLLREDLQREVNGENEPDMAEEIDYVNHPPHYTDHPSGVECITITEHYNFNIGNAIKYLWRCDSKSAPIEDLKKASWYVNREIEKREREADPQQ